MTCWRRLRVWQASGLWHRLHLLLLLAELRGADRLDFGRASMDGASVPSPWGMHTGPNPTDRAKLGSKRHLVTDARGIPLMFCVTGANRHDSVVFESLVDALPAVAGKPDRLRRWPDKFHADEGYDFARCRKHLALCGIKDRNDRLGRHRWVVELTHAWLAAFGKLRVRFER